MLRRFRIMVALVTVASSVVACTKEAPRPAPDPLRVPAGVVFLGVGPSDTSLNLVAVGSNDRAPTRLTALPAGQGVSWVAAAAGRLVVAAPVEHFDRIAEYVNGQFKVIEREPSYRPSLSADGRLAYTRLVPGSMSQVDLMVVDRAGRRRSIGRFSPHDGPTAWGPGNEIALGTGAGDPESHTLILDARTGRRLHEWLAPRTLDLFWAPYAPIAYHDNHPEHGGGLLDPASGRSTRIPNGWLPLTWSPDGRRLLATDRSRRHLALIDPRRPQAPQRLPGTAGQPIWIAAWTLTPPGLVPIPN